MHLVAVYKDTSMILSRFNEGDGALQVAQKVLPSIVHDLQHL